MAYEARLSVSLMLILTSSVIYHCKDSRQHGIDLFYMTKERNVVDGDVVSKN